MRKGQEEGILASQNSYNFPGTGFTLEKSDFHYIIN